MRIISTKKQHRLALQVIANYLIGKDALNRANIDGKLSMEEWGDAVGHLTQNTIDLLTALVGTDSFKYYSERFSLGISKP